MLSALLFLHLTSLRNSLVERAKRLKNPRYLVGFVVGLLYFYFFVFRNAARGFSGSRPRGMPSNVPLPDITVLGQFVEPVAAMVVLLSVALAWIIPRKRAALQFTEAEISFLFPAPISRTTLIHYKLLKSQLAIMITSLLLSLVSLRWSFLGGSGWIHALGAWMLFSTLSLHNLAASFSQERLLGMGLPVWVRSSLATVLLVTFGAGCWYWFVNVAPEPPASNKMSDLLGYAHSLLTAPPIGWVLAPFRAMVRPFFAGDATQFLSACVPGLLVMVAHYFWALRSQISFEEASIARAEKRAAFVAAKQGKGSWRPQKAKPEPFKLSPVGLQPLAFLWRGLIAAGRLFYPCTWMLVALVLWGALVVATRIPSLVSLSKILGIISATAALWMLFFGPLISRRGVSLMLERIDVVKTYPLKGWQIVCGELLTSLVVLTAIEWLLLGCATICLVPDRGMPELVRALAGYGSIVLALVAPPLMGLMLAIPFAAALYFPAWMSVMGRPGASGGGIEVVGQRILFSFAYMITLVVAVLPAALLGAIPFFLIKYLTHSLSYASYAGALVAAAFVIVELCAVIWILGRRYDHFDMSTEMPRGA